MSEDERATVIVLAPTRKEFGCGVCDQTRVLVDRLREIGTPVKTVHYDGKPFTEDIGAQAGDLVFLQLSIYGCFFCSTVAA